MKRAREAAGSPEPRQAGKASVDTAQQPTAPQLGIADPSLQAVTYNVTGHSSESSADQLQDASAPTQSQTESRHPNQPPAASPEAQSQTESRIADPPQQIHFESVLELDSLEAPPKRLQLLAGHRPFPQHYQTWLEQQHNPLVCSIRLIGDASRPHDYVGAGVQELITHSPWAAAWLRQTDMRPSGLETVVPICTPAAVVKELVEALYCGFIELQHDVERMLVLANCLQVTVDCSMML